MQFAFSSKRRKGFTLAELLVSAAIIVMIMGFLFVTVDQTRRTIDSTTSKVAQFQSARVAFDAMTRNLSQATLQTYWDLDYNASGNPIRFGRQADLHFVIDKASLLVSRPADPSVPGSQTTTPTHFPGHGVFFQAPLGMTSEDMSSNATNPSGFRKYRALSNLLSVAGYYVEWGVDPQVPEFIKTSATLAKPKYRFRLMEVAQPAEANMIYYNSNYTTILGKPTNASPFLNPRDWIKVATGQLNLPLKIAGIHAGKKLNSARPLAENVIGLILLPKVSERERTGSQINDLTGTNCVYDSRPIEAYNLQKRSYAAGDLKDTATAITDLYKRKQLHQLPPIVQVTMIAIDEESGAKLQDYSTSPPTWMDGMFGSFSTEANFQNELGVGDPTTISSTSLVYKLSNPQRTLPTPRVNYRIFTTDVVLRGSKWSKNIQ